MAGNGLISPADVGKVEVERGDSNESAISCASGGVEGTGGVWLAGVAGRWEAGRRLGGRPPSAGGWDGPDKWGPA